MRTSGLVIVVAIGLLGVAGGCKKKRNYDRSTPDAALASFFKALNSGHLPGDLPELVQGHEVQAWKMRCKNRGCKKGTFEILPSSERSDYEATLVTNYDVFGNDDGRVMRGKESPIKLIREADRWYLVQFGRREGDPSAVIPADGGPQVHDGGATSFDAGALYDGGGDGSRDSAPEAP